MCRWHVDRHQTIHTTITNVAQFFRFKGPNHHCVSRPTRLERPAHFCILSSGPVFQKEVSHVQLLQPTIFFEPMSKRRRGFPSETQVKRGVRIVHGDKELAEKLGRNDLCPCGSGKRFKKCCLKSSRF
jgi:hypothetical protein